MSISNKEIIIAGTLQTDPRSGGIKRSSGVNVLPIVAETWAEVRDDQNSDVDWLIAGYDKNSKTDITILSKGKGGMERCSSSLPDDAAAFGGCKLRTNGRFVTFFYIGDETPPMQRGRASMHKNGVLNVLEGSDREIDMRPGLTEEELILQVSKPEGGLAGSDATRRKTPPVMSKQNLSRENSAKVVVSVAGTFDEEGGVTLDSRSVPRDVSSVDAIPPAAPKQTEQKSKNIATTVPPPTVSVAGTIVPYAQLKGIRDVSELPPGVDPLNREQSLSDDEFKEVFGMDRGSFLAQPAWKRKSQKQARGLF